MASNTSDSLPNPYQSPASVEMAAPAAPPKPLPAPHATLFSGIVGLVIGVPVLIELGYELCRGWITRPQTGSIVLGLFLLQAIAIMAVSGFLVLRAIRQIRTRS